MLELVIAILGGNVLLLSAVALLAKSLIEQSLKKDFERFTSELKAKSEMTMEQLKNKFQIIALEHEVKFTKLHEKRATVIADLYTLLIDTEYAMNSYISSIQSDTAPPSVQKAVTEAVAKITETIQYIHRSEIYFPESACESLNNYISLLGGLAIIHIIANEKYNEEAIDELIKVWNQTDDSRKKAKNTLQDEMRILLGNNKSVLIRKPANT